MDERPHIHVFSSDYRRLYKQDIYDCLAYPPGFQVRFRYRRDFVSEEILCEDDASLKADIKLGERALIHAVANRNNNDDLEIIPVRVAEVINHEVHSETLYLDLKLTDELVDHTSSRDDIHEYDNLSEHPLRDDEILVTKSDEFNFQTNADHRGCDDQQIENWKNSESEWESVIDKLCKTQSFEDSFYYRLVSVSVAFGKGDNIKVTEFEDHLNVGYKLHSEKNYQVEYSLYYPYEPSEDDNPFEFTIDSDEDDLIIRPNSFSSGFKTDRRRVYIHPRFSITPFGSLLSNRLDGENIPESPQIDIPIQVVPNKRKKRFILVGMFVGVLLAGGAHQYPIEYFGLSELFGTIEGILHVVGALIFTYFIRLFSVYL